MPDEKPIPVENGLPPPPLPPRDYTQERKDRCKPVIEQILKLMLEKKVVLSSDLTYIEKIVNEHLRNICEHIIFENAQELFGSLNESINHWFDFAIEKKLGKPIADLTLEDVEQMINPAPVEEPEEKPEDKSKGKDAA